MFIELKQPRSQLAGRLSDLIVKVRGGADAKDGEAPIVRLIAKLIEPIVPTELKSRSQPINPPKSSE